MWPQFVWYSINWLQTNWITMPPIHEERVSYTRLTEMLQAVGLTVYSRSKPMGNKQLDLTCSLPVKVEVTRRYLRPSGRHVHTYIVSNPLKSVLLIFDPEQVPGGRVLWKWVDKLPYPLSVLPPHECMVDVYRRCNLFWVKVNHHFDNHLPISWVPVGITDSRNYYIILEQDKRVSYIRNTTINILKITLHLCKKSSKMVYFVQVFLKSPGRKVCMMSIFTHNGMWCT